MGDDLAAVRVKAIAPLLLDEAELSRRQQRYRRLSGAMVHVDLCNLAGKDPPRRLDSAEDVERSTAAVIAMARATDPDAYDLVLPDCVLDPAVDVADTLPVPIVGILQLAGGFLAALGRFGAVARNEAIAAELRRKADSYGLGTQLVAVEVSGGDFCLIDDADGWQRSLAPAIRRMEDLGLRVLFNGCSAVEVRQRPDSSVRVVDPTSLALGLIAAGAAGGALAISSTGHVSRG